MKKITLWAFLALVTLLCPSFVYAVTIGQTDDFQDGTTQNWVINLLGIGSPPFPPVNVPSGGPAGVGDSYLKLTSTGVPGAGGRMVGINYKNQWAGDYIAAGITGIRMDVRNLGSTDLYLRLLFADPMDAPPSNEAYTTTSIFLPAGSDWTSVVFRVGPSFLTADIGTALAALTNTTELRIINTKKIISGSPEPPFVAAMLGVDNVTAVVVPEPATFILLGAGLAGLLASRVRLEARRGRG